MSFKLLSVPVARHAVARTEVNFDPGVRYVAGKERRPRLNAASFKRRVRGVAKEINARGSIRGNTVHTKQLVAMYLFWFNHILGQSRDI